MVGFSLSSLNPDSVPAPLIFGTLSVAAIFASVAVYLVLSDK